MFSLKRYSMLLIVNCNCTDPIGIIAESGFGKTVGGAGDTLLSGGGVLVIAPLVSGRGVWIAVL
jgi:hypothetical protein